MLERLLKEAKHGTKVVGMFERDECGATGDGDSATEEQRGVGAKALFDDGRSQSNKENRATILKMLTPLGAVTEPTL